MNDRELFAEAIAAHPNEAHLHFTIVDPDIWSVFPANTCDATQMRKAGWDGPFQYMVDNIQYDAFGKGARCNESMKLFLDDLGRDADSTAQITCPSCGEILELPISSEGQHFRCSTCNKKFIVKGKKAVLIQDSSNEKKPLRAKLIEDNISVSQRQSTYFQLEKIRGSKDLFKYGRLFSIAPMSVKIATIFVIIQVLLGLMIQEGTAGKSQTTTYFFEFFTLWLLSGVLKGYNWSRWILLVIRGSAFVLTPILYFSATKSNSEWEANFYADLMWSVVGTFITSIPYMIALVMPSANRWFKGYVADMNKLHKAVEDDMKPMTFGKQVVVVLIIALILVGIGTGRHLLSGVVQKSDGNEAQIKAESAILEGINSEYQKRVQANRFGEVLNDADLLFARRNVEDTKWRIKDAKEFLNAFITKSKIELNKDRGLDKKSNQYREFNEMRGKVLNLLKDYYQAQLDMVEQAEKIFYSSRMNSRDCPEDERMRLQKRYGKYSHFSTSKVELQKLIDLNNKMLKMAKVLQTNADAISGS